MRAGGGMGGLEGCRLGRGGLGKVEAWLEGGWRQAGGDGRGWESWMVDGWKGGKVGGCAGGKVGGREGGMVGGWEGG